MRDGPGLLAQNVPRSLTREGRVALLAEVADAMLRGTLPSPEARLFVASAVQAYLQTGGALERHLRIGAPRGSHHRPHVLYRKLLIHDERQPDDAPIDSDNFTNEGTES